MGTETNASDVSLSAETAKATAAKFSMAAIGFVGTIIFARILGPERFGAYYLLFALVKIADLPIEGWSIAAKKRFSESGTNTSEVVGAQLLFLGSWLGIGAIGILFISSLLSSYTGIHEAWKLFFAIFAGEAIYVSSERLLQARGLVGKATWTDALRSYITFPLQVLLVLSGWGVAGMAYGLAAASIIVTPLTLYFLSVTPQVPSRSAVVSQWSYAKYSVLSTLFGRVYERFDILLLGYLLGPTAAGWYEVAYKLVTPGTFIAETASSGLMPRVSHLSSKGESFVDDVTNVLSFASILAVPIFCGALVIAEPLIVTIYGSAYSAAAPLLIVIALYHIVMTQNAVLGQTVFGLDRPRSLALIAASSLIVNIILGVLLVPIVGPVGAAISSAIAELTTSALLVWSLSNTLQEFQFLTPELMKQGVSGGIMIGVLSLTIPMSTGAEGIVPALIAGGAIYFGVLIYISSEFRTTIRAVLTGVF